MPLGAAGGKLCHQAVRSCSRACKIAWLVGPLSWEGGAAVYGSNATSSFVPTLGKQFTMIASLFAEVFIFRIITAGIII